MAGVLERAELTIKEGQEAAFIGTVRKVRHIAVDAAGCNGFRVSQGIEHPSRFLMLIEWDSVEAHTAFTRTAQFKEFAGPLRAFYAEPSQVSHYRDEA